MGNYDGTVYLYYTWPALGVEPQTLWSWFQCRIQKATFVSALGPRPCPTLHPPFVPYPPPPQQNNNNNKKNTSF